MGDCLSWAYLHTLFEAIQSLHLDYHLFMNVEYNYVLYIYNKTDEFPIEVWKTNTGVLINATKFYKVNK